MKDPNTMLCFLSKTVNTMHRIKLVHSGLFLRFRAVSEVKCICSIYYENMKRVFLTCITGNTDLKAHKGRLWIFLNRLASIMKKRFHGLVDTICQSVVALSIDLAFPKYFTMRYMGELRLINSHLKNDWVHEVPDIESIREKFIYAFTRLADAQNLKRRRENIIFPTLLGRLKSYAENTLLTKSPSFSVFK